MDIFIEFAFGNIWRAVLFEFLTPLAMIACIQFVDTPFTACVIRGIIEDNCCSLGTITGRIFFNGLLVFFCFETWKTVYTALLIPPILVAIWSGVIYYYYRKLKATSQYIRIATGSVKKIRRKILTI